MLHKCANSSCSNRFRRLSEGKLFQMESERFPIASDGCRSTRARRRVEHFWLCPECADYWTLAFEKGRGMIVVPRVPDKRPTKGVALADFKTAERMSVGSSQS